MSRYYDVQLDYEKRGYTIEPTLHPQEYLVNNLETAVSTVLVYGEVYIVEDILDPLKERLNNRYFELLNPSEDIIPYGLLPDWAIKRLCEDHDMISPYHDHLAQQDVISYGLSSTGYDIRLGYDFKIFSPYNGSATVIDPKNFDENCLIDFDGDVCVIPPNSYVLARSLETFKLPADITAECLGKSTYARSGVFVNITPIENEWRGTLTIEIANLSPLPVKIYGGEGIAQLRFYRTIRPSVTYADRNGKYQDQLNVTLPKISHSSDETSFKRGDQVECNGEYGIVWEVGETTCDLYIWSLITEHKLLTDQTITVDSKDLTKYERYYQHKVDDLVTFIENSDVQFAYIK